MDDFVAAAEAEHGLDVRAAAAHDAPRVGIRIGGHAARHLRALGAQHADGVAALETALRAASRRPAAGCGRRAAPRSAPASICTRAGRAAGCRRSTACAPPPASSAAGTRCSARLPASSRFSGCRWCPAAMHMWQPAPTAIFAAAILVAMPPLPTAEAEPPAIASISRRDALDLGMNSGRGVAVGIAGVQAVDVGEQHQAVGARHLRHARGQPVVVAVADLGGRDRVVLVDDRDRAQRQQRLERGARIQVARRCSLSSQRQQHLRHGHVGRARAVPCRHAPGGSGPPPRPPGSAPAAARPRGRPRWRRPSAMAPDDTRMTCWPRRRRRSRSAHSVSSQARFSRPVPLIDQQRRAHLDDDAARLATAYGGCCLVAPCMRSVLEQPRA